MTIANCFRKAGFRNEYEVKPDEAFDTAKEYRHPYETQEPFLLRLFKELNIAPSQYFGIDDDVATTSLISSTTPLVPPPSTSPDTASMEFSGEEDVCEQEKERVSIKIVFDCVQQINTYCLRSGSGCKEEITTVFNAFKCLLEKHEASATKTQTRIDQFF